MKKGVFISIFVLVILSSSVYAFSLKDLLNDIFASPSHSIINASVYPQKVRPGEVMLTTISVEDYFGINDAVAQIGHEGGFDSVKLNLIDGSKYKGTYSGSWIVHSTKNQQWYNTTIIVTNERGGTASAIVSWQDPTVSHAASSITSGNFSGGNYTFDNRLLIIDSTNSRIVIGTGTPTAKLHAVGDLNVSANATIAGGLLIGASDYTKTGSYLLNVSGNASINNTLFVNYDGNVGIGTASPGASRLYVNGNVSFVGNVYINKGDNIIPASSFYDIVLPVGTGVVYVEAYHGVDGHVHMMAVTFSTRGGVDNYVAQAWATTSSHTVFSISLVGGNLRLTNLYAVDNPTKWAIIQW